MIKVDIYGITAIGDLLDLVQDKESKRRRKRQEFLELDRRVQGNARRLAFEELLTAYHGLVDALSQSQSFVDITGKSSQDVRNVKVRAYEIIHGVNPNPKEVLEIPYDLKVYRNPKILLDLSLTANPVEHDGCSELEVLMASFRSELITGSAKLLQQTARIPFRLCRYTSLQIYGANLGDYNSVRGLVSEYKPVFDKTEIYKRLRGRALTERQGEIIFEDFEMERGTKA